MLQLCSSARSNRTLGRARISSSDSRCPDIAEVSWSTRLVVRITPSSTSSRPCIASLRSKCIRPPSRPPAGVMCPRRRSSSVLSRSPCQSGDSASSVRPLIGVCRAVSSRSAMLVVPSWLPTARVASSRWVATLALLWPRLGRAPGDDGILPAKPSAPPADGVSGSRSGSRFSSSMLIVLLRVWTSRVGDGVSQISLAVLFSGVPSSSSMVLTKMRLTAWRKFGTLGAPDV
mmetsp:Transcript_128388/g.363324  ORF Transcript_128388/g.363324 Transcript_128388/m.363324 type:complete len:231 (-) Transcript_128388:638-1330(-)